MHNSPLMKRFASEPALVASDLQERFEGCIAGLMAQEHAMEALTGNMAAANDDFWATDGWERYYRPYIVVDGILNIPVQGVLLNSFPYAFGDWATGYEYIWKAFERGLDDNAVKGIALLVDSPGGMVAGNFDLVDKMYARKGEKPVRGYANEAAYSAAYSIISACDTVTVARTGGVGSIGVVSMHIDRSRQLDADGMTLTFIKKGAHKTDGNPYEPLSKATLDRLEEKMELPYSIFVATVARNRNLTEAFVRSTEAATYTAPESLSNGLADSVSSLEDALVVFAADLSSSNEEEDNMVDQATHDAAVAQARTDGHAEGLAAGRTEGTTAERTRIAAIVGLDEAQDRQPAALTIATTTDLSVDQVKVLLPTLGAAAPAAPAAAAAASTSSFGDLMSTSGNPDLGADPAANPATAKDDGSSDVALARSFGLTGLKPKS